MKETRSYSFRTETLCAGAVAVLLAGCGSGGDDQDALRASTAAQACAALAGKTVNGAVLTAATVAASAVTPGYCKINGTLPPQLNFEIRLPESWNGKLHYQGGGGYNGTIPDVMLSAAALAQGYASASSDSGHQGSLLDASFALNDPAAATLFGSLSIPTVMSAAVAAVTAAYGQAPSKSYYEGCSNGGREGLMNVQRYPHLFDGVIARAPAYNWVGLMGAFNRTSKALSVPGAALSAAKTSLLARSVRNACDGLDGIVDGVVSNPAACTPAVFNPASLRCTGGADTGDSCLSDPQLAAIATYTGDSVFAGSPTYRNAGWSLTGNEDSPTGLGLWVTGNGSVEKSLRFQFQDTTVKNYLAKNAGANSLEYTPWDRSIEALNSMAALNDATDTNLRPFAARGAKLILWHGGSDPAISANSTAEYYANAVSSAGGKNMADAFMRFYVAPGVDHCAGGAGADTSNLLGALDNWVVSGNAPGNLTAQKMDAATGLSQFERPLCQHPKYPRYTGPTNDANAAKLASNYACT